MSFANPLSLFFPLERADQPPVRLGYGGIGSRLRILRADWDGDRGECEELTGDLIMIQVDLPSLDLPRRAAPALA